MPSLSATSFGLSDASDGRATQLDAQARRSVELVERGTRRAGSSLELYHDTQLLFGAAVL